MLWRFVHYLSRYGLQSIRRFGHKINKDLNKLQRLLNEIDVPDGPTRNLESIQYIEHKKQKDKIDTNFKTLTQTIIHLVDVYNIKSQTDWDLKIDKDTKTHLIGQYGLKVNNYIQSVLKINKMEHIKMLKNLTSGQVYNMHLKEKTEIPTN